MKNRVAKLTAIGKVELFEETLSPLASDEVLIRIKAVGICGSDIHYFLEGGLGSFKQKLPMPMGHEPAGIVAESHAAEFKKGDRVTVEPGRACFHCTWCTRGKQNLCENVQFMGANAPGALADYVIVHKSQLAKIPASMSFGVASLLEPLGIGLHAANLVKPRHTETAIIVGAGPIGLCLLKVLRAVGLRDIYMVDTLPYRVAFAKKFGASDAFLAKDAVAHIKELTHNRGARYVFDTAGTQGAVTLCGDLVGVGGTIALIGIPTEDTITYNPHKLRTREVTVQNVRRSNQTLHDCVALFKNDRDLRKLITHSLPLKDVQKGFTLVSKNRGGVIKCVITND